MADTREKIMATALRLFATDGYKAVSVSAIAGELGMTKGALYKHFKSKRDIFDCIVRRMYQIDEARARLYAMPEHPYEDSPQEYAQLSVRSMKDFTLGQFEFWAQDGFAADFCRMLTLEQYRDPEMGRLYSGCMTAGPVAYMADIFAEMMKRGVLRQSDPKLLALEYYAPLYLLLNMAEGTRKREAALLLDAHVERFIKNNILEKAEE